MASPVKRLSRKWSTANEVWTEYCLGRTLPEIAQERGLTVSQVEKALEFARARSSVGANDDMRQDAIRALRGRLYKLYRLFDSAVENGVRQTEQVVMRDSAGNILSDPDGRPVMRPTVVRQTKGPDAYLPIAKEIRETEEKLHKLQGIVQEKSGQLVGISFSPVLSVGQQGQLAPELQGAIAGGEQLPYQLRQIADSVDENDEVIDAEFRVEDKEPVNAGQ